MTLCLLAKGLQAPNPLAPDPFGSERAYAQPGSAPTAVSGTPYGDIKVLVDRADYTFAESLTFHLTATSRRPVDEVILRYTVAGAEVVNRRVATLTPGKVLSAEHTETLARGEMPPAAEIRWWWRLEGPDGVVGETMPQSVRYLDQRFEWRSTDGRDVRIWYYDKAPTEVEAIAEESRAALAALKTTFGRLPEKRIEIVAYNSQDDMRSGLIDRGGTYEARLSTLGARVAPDILLIDTGTVGELSESRMRAKVLAHELSHIVMHLLFRHDYLDAPLWLDEGLAMVAEGPLNARDQQLLDRALREDELLSVRSLSTFPGDAGLVSLAYAESHDLVSFLRRHGGPEAFRAFLQALASGEKTTDEALTTVYDFDQLGFYQAYRADKGLPAALPPTPGAPTPRATTTPSRPCSAPGVLLLPLALLALIRHGGTKPSRS